jgi:hypothetical protein
MSTATNACLHRRKSPPVMAKGQVAPHDPLNPAFDQEVCLCVCACVCVFVWCTTCDDQTKGQAAPHNPFKTVLTKRFSRSTQCSAHPCFIPFLPLRLLDGCVRFLYGHVSTFIVTHTYSHSLHTDANTHTRSPARHSSTPKVPSYSHT